MANEKRRLIDADVLMDGQFPEVENEYQQGWNDALQGAFLALKPVDAVPVVHGRWLPQILLGQRVWDCSECKTLGSPQWKVCPVCESIMDLPRITDQTKNALEKMDEKAHGGERVCLDQIHT